MNLRRNSSDPGGGEVGSARHVILIAFDEVALKRGQRSRFIEQLRRNILDQIDCEPGRLALRHGRLELEFRPESEDELWRRCSSSLGRVFGIKWFGRAEAVPVDLDALEAAVVRRAIAAVESGARTFKLEHSRKNKAFPIESQELNRRVGARVRQAAPELSVDVHQPELLIVVEIRRDQVTVFADRQPGADGLPIGTTGSALALLSGGIDSPVAAWYSMKRGLRVECVHFHSPPYTGLKAEEKVRDLVHALNHWTPEPVRLLLVPFSRIQEEIAERIPAEYWTIVQRRFMQRIAGRLAEQCGFDALAVGDSIGQVASQTLSNMAAIDAASPHLVLRPLLGFNKADIIARARTIGTYEISIRPFEDCCVLFAPRKPAIQCDLKVVEAHERELNQDGLIDEALESLTSS